MYSFSVKGRSSHRRCSVRKGVLRNFAKFTGKHLCQSLFFNKVAGLRPQACNFIKKETLAQVFSCEFCEISKNSFLTEHLRATASVKVGTEAVVRTCSSKYETPVLESLFNKVAGLMSYSLQSMLFTEFQGKNSLNTLFSLFTL